MYIENNSDAFISIVTFDSKQDLASHLQHTQNRFGGATYRLQTSTMQIDYNIFGRWMWPTIHIDYKNGTIHIAYSVTLQNDY